MIVINCEQRSEAWHLARLGRVTGTTFSDLVAAKTTAGYMNLVSDIAADMVTDSAEESEGYINEAMQTGIDREPDARDLYRLLMEADVTEVGFCIPDEDNPFHEWAGVSPDGLVGEDGMIEIKCPKRSTHIRYIAAGKLPSTYHWQVQGQLWVTGRKWCDFISYYPNMKPFILRVFPEQEAFNRIEIEMNLLIPKVQEQVEAYKNYSHE